jgi:PDZ domain-containing protein
VSRRVAVQVTAGIVLVLLVAVGAWLPMPYVSLSPGPVFDTLGEQDGEPLIVIEGATTYPTDGRLDLTTVSESGGPRSRLGLLEAVKDWVDPNAVVVPERTLYTGQETAEEVEQRNAEDMELSQENAVTAAMNQLGIATTTEVVVRSIAQESPALGKLQAGDVILAVDGTPVTSAVQSRDLIRARAPGEDVAIKVRRDTADGSEQLEVVVTTEPSPADPAIAYIGVAPGEVQVPPFEVALSLDRVGGPSAGLMFALGIVDKLTPEQENGGKHVAGTGTIDADGSVGPIGGIQQKLRGARDAGATVFLVPTENCEDAAGAGVDGLRLVRVATLSDALTGMAAVVTGQPAPTCR